MYETGELCAQAPPCWSHNLSRAAVLLAPLHAAIVPSAFRLVSICTFVLVSKSRKVAALIPLQNALALFAGVVECAAPRLLRSVFVRLY